MNFTQLREKYEHLYKFLTYQAKKQNQSYTLSDFAKQFYFQLYEKIHVDDNQTCIFLEYSRSSGYGDLLLGFKM